MNKIKELRGLVIGGGSIGERHIFNLKKMGLKKIAILDSDKKRSNHLATKYNIKNFENIESSMSFNPDFSLICTWADSHMSLAKFCLKNNSHIFIEKPISNESKGVKEFLKNADYKKLNIAIGYNMRFEKSLNILKKQIQEKKVGETLSIHSQWGNNIKNWIHPDKKGGHYIEKSGGGVILDDSHEYDYVQWLMADKIESVYCQTHVTDKSKTENLASMIMKFKGGAIASFVIDFARPRYERFCHVISDNGDIKWNFSRTSQLKQYQTEANSSITTQKLHVKKLHKNFSYCLNELYESEIKDFLDSIIKHRKPKVTGWDGLDTLNIGLAALRSSKTNRAIKF